MPDHLIYRPGELNAGYVHQRLVELGYSVEQAELDADFYGPSTEAAVRLLQRDQRLRLVDGVVGPQTLHALEHPITTRFTAPGWRYDRDRVHAELVRVCDLAVGDMGLRESPDGSNDGPDLKKFRTAGEPWCACALSHWYAGAEGGCPWGRTASTWAVYQWALRAGRVLAAGEPVAPGDIWYVRRPPPPGKTTPRGHVCLVVTALPGPGDRLACVGGNEGNAVRGSVRPRAGATAIIRPLPR